MAVSIGDYFSKMLDQNMNWKDAEKLCADWDGQFALKGIMSVEDAKRAVDIGCTGIMVSNHGGRQLDGALSSIRMLPDIVDAVGDQIEVHMDGGIRSGQDVLKAIALGAKGTMIGRSYVYGLGAMGRQGVEIALETIRKELDTTMALCGERVLSEMGRENLLIPADFRGVWE